MKEVIEKKERGTCDSFLKKLIIDKVKITDTKIITETFNNFFVMIKRHLVKKNGSNFKAHISKVNTKLT